jgi:hypothetical protein
VRRLVPSALAQVPLEAQLAHEPIVFTVYCHGRARALEELAVPGGWAQPNSSLQSDGPPFGVRARCLFAGPPSAALGEPNGRIDRALNGRCRAARR